MPDTRLVQPFYVTQTTVFRGLGPIKNGIENTKVHSHDTSTPYCHRFIHTTRQLSHTDQQTRHKADLSKLCTGAELRTCCSSCERDSSCGNTLTIPCHEAELVSQTPASILPRSCLPGAFSISGTDSRVSLAPSSLHVLLPAWRNGLISPITCSIHGDSCDFPSGLRSFHNRMPRDTRVSLPLEKPAGRQVCDQVKTEVRKQLYLCVFIISV